jgi:hypothetical protein
MADPSLSCPSNATPAHDHKGEIYIQVGNY